MLHRSTLLLISSLLLLSSCSNTPATSTSTADQNTVDFPQFTADAGVRLEDASNAGVKMSGDGVLSLVYQDSTIKHDRLTTSTEDSDWLEFASRGTELKDRTDFYVVTLPDGTYKTYGYNPTKGLEDQTCLTSKSSTDGVHFTADSGCRYTLQSGDKGTMGVWDVFTTQSGNVDLLYIGDMLGMNNVRQAVSTDNGETFVFKTDNILGDINAGGGPASYVDERSMRMSDGRILLVAMKQGNIYEFISEDDGDSFMMNPEPILTNKSFDGLKAIGLHDPQLVQLPDGRIRIYMALALDNGATPGDNIEPPAVLVSATTSN